MSEKSSTFTRASAGYERVVVPAVFACVFDGGYVGSRSVADSDASHHRFAYPLTRLEKSVAAGVNP